MNGGTKLDYLNSVEDFDYQESNVQNDKPKHMATFPYPYMNGKLHLGHLYSLSKADFYTYFKKLQGYNVLFPFAFHCTGMPISASAYKLKQELTGHEVDVSVVKILNGLGFDDVEKFTDPLHWIRTFPNYAIESLKKFHACIDWRRSFITTEINKYYDSFVQYQFNKLKRLGYLNFGKRYSIFCPIDQQACLDHDRRKGEGVKPVEAILRKIKVEDDTYLLVRSKNTLAIEKVVFTKNKDFSKFLLSGKKYICEDEIYENLKYQIEGQEFESKMCATELIFDSLKVELIDIEIAGKIANVKSANQKTIPECEEYKQILGLKNEKLVLVETENFVKVYIPEEPVISRSGSLCVVSLLDQWYIDYSLPDWKEKARRCLSKMTLTDDTRFKLGEALEWINKWGFSRSFGLGTHIPWDKQYLIDSLSDSTIYNAFYTFKHFMFSDLEGKQEILPSSILCEDVWKYIFGDIDSLPQKLVPYYGILDNSKASFEYFYPVDIRVSGKDLIGNHLIFFIFNHVALFEEKYWPKRIFTNGHLMLNSAKMSKSDGNYLTVEDALTKFGASATRMCLADCGDVNEDANFLESSSNSFVLKLYTLTKTVESLTETSELDVNILVGKMNRMALTEVMRYDLFINEYFLESISKNIRLCLESHEKMVYRDVLKFGFFENWRLLELYNTLGGKSNTIINYGYKTILSLLYPIIPSLSTYLLKLKFDGKISVPEIYRSEENKVKAVEYIKDLCSKINSLNKKEQSVEISVCNEYCDWKTECMKIVNNCSNKGEIVKNCGPILKKFNVHSGKGMVFCMDYYADKSKYLLSFDERDTLQLFKSYIMNNTKKTVSIVKGSTSEPLQPSLRFY